MSDAEASAPIVETTATEPSLSRIPFSTDDEENIKSLAWWLRASGAVTLLTVVVGVAEMFRTQNFANVLGMIMMTACAIFGIQAAGFFYKVATTDEADQAYLVGGFRKLRLAYLLLSVWILVGLAFLGTFLLFALVAAVLFAAK
jgi:uncharacterized membrane-anchored protein